MTRAERRIPVRENTFEALGDFEGAGETWDDVSQELIECRRRENRGLLHERPDDDESVPLDDV